MRSALPKWRKYRSRVLGGLAVPLCFSVLGGGGTAAEPPPLVTPPAAAAPAAVVTLDLAACRGIALEKQPALAAAQASLAAAEARKRGLDQVIVGRLLAPDLPIRRQQACLSVTIAQAAVKQTEWETLYAVTRTYFSAVYARQQQAVLDARLGDLKLLQEAVQRLLDTGAANVTTRDKERVAVYVPLVQGRREEAVQGYQRALAALREAMGVGPNYCFEPADPTLPFPNPPVNCEELVGLALAGRGEMTQAAVAAEITAYEIKAQKTSFLPTARTFASAGDIHARPVPQGLSNSEYRPGALSLEMPPSLAGSRAGRIDQARALNARAQSVVDKTRDLITLETEDAYLKWLEASRKLVQFDDAADKATQLARSVRDDLEKAASRTTPEQVLNAGVQATELRVRANEALYQYLLALAALERVTAGGFCAGLSARGPSRVP
jgi:outer membrane protein TolC